MILILKTLEALFDFVLVILAFFLAYFFRLSIYQILNGANWVHSDYPIGDFIFQSSLVALLVVGVFIYQGRYSPTKPYKNLINTFSASVIGATAFVLLYFFGREIFFSRLIPVYALILMFVLLSFSYFVSTKIFSFNLIRKKFGKKILIIGANLNAEYLIKALQEDAGVRNIIGILDAYGTKKKDIAGIPVLGKMNIFEEVILKKGIEEIIQVDNLEQALNISTFCENHKIDYSFSTSISGIYHNNTSVCQLSTGDSLVCLNTK